MTTKRLTMNLMKMTEADLADHHDVLPELQHLRVALHHLIELMYWQTFKWQTSLSSKPRYHKNQEYLSKDRSGEKDGGT